jgi:predicted nuclease of predicted toxin-antitoxin system
MKILIDANLPMSITSFFPDHEVVHTLQLQEGNLTKVSINSPFQKNMPS